MRLFLCLIALSTALNSASLKVVSWNVESGGATPAKLAEVIAAQQGVDLWGLSEVQDQTWVNQFKTAAAQGESGTFDSVTGTTGGQDRLAVVYNSTRFERVRFVELAAINIGGNVRAPLAVELRERAGGASFWFMVNHLYRGNASARHQQATMLNEWARSQTIPVVAVGDYNFDWEVVGGETNHDRGYDNMVAAGTFRWVRPATLVKTQCSQFNSVLDFVFVAGTARDWSATSEILFAGDVNYCPDTSQTSDHRPVLAAFETSPATGPPPPGGPTREEILRRISEIERALGEVRQAVERLPN